MVIKRPTEKNTKTEILAAFEELLKEKKALETQLTTPVAVAPTPNGKTVPEPKPKPVLPAPQGMEAIVESLNRLQMGFGGAISDLSEKLVLEAVKLQDLQESVSEETQALQTLHNLQFTDGSLDTLIQQYEDSSKTFNEELRESQETISQELTQSRKTWAKEREERDRLVKERNESVSKTRQRDSKEYTYDLTLQRNLSNDEYEQEKKRLYQELEELQQTQTKQWNEREKTIADREKQFEELKTRVDSIPKELEAAIKRAKEEGKGIANQQAKVKADLLAKEIEGQKNTYELRVDFLEETIEDQQTRLQTLSKQLDAALKQVQDLAVKAIEGAADVSSFQAVKEIALEQAKNQNKAK